MEMLAVTAVRVRNGRQEAFMLGRVNTATNRWIADPKPLETLEVVDLLLSGDKIGTIFATAGGTVAGPMLRVHTHDDGVETVTADGEPIEGRRVEDLPRF
jgi:hypothetical protein